MDSRTATVKWVGAIWFRRKFDLPRDLLGDFERCRPGARLKIPRGMIQNLTPRGHAEEFPSSSLEPIRQSAAAETIPDTGDLERT